jgi:hypothetical protein
MGYRLAARMLLFACAFLGPVGVGHAGSYTIGPGSGFATIVMPNSWHVTVTNTGLETATKDEEVYLWAEGYTKASLDGLSEVHQRYFDRQDVVTTGKAVTKNGTVNGIPAVFMDIPATWKGKPTILQYVFLDPGPDSKWKLLLCEWASPAGNKQYDPDLQAILSSVKFLAR